MIDYVRLKNFKCFRDETIRFGGLTVLSGRNGAGKSQRDSGRIGTSPAMGINSGIIVVRFPGESWFVPGCASQ